MNNNLLPKEQYELKTFERLKVLKQHLSQLVLSFLAHYNLIEYILIQKPDERFGRYHIITEVHNYSKNSLPLCNCIGKTCAELKKALCNIERIEKLFSSITVQDTFKTNSYREKKLHISGCTKNSATKPLQNKPKQISTELSIKSKKTHILAATDSRKDANIKYYNCHKKGI